MKKTFDILEHTADVKIKAYGRTREELFENAMLGMMDLMKIDYEKAAVFKKRDIEVESVSEDLLLIDFLSEVLLTCDLNNEGYTQALIKILPEGNRLNAVLNGKKFKDRGLEIKAVTYHNFEIKKSAEGLFSAEIIFDI